MTPTAFLNRRRVKTASRLLRSGRYSVNEVAKLAGFRNRITLFRHITRATGISPKEVKSDVDAKIEPSAKPAHTTIT